MSRAVLMSRVALESYRCVLVEKYEIFLKDDLYVVYCILR